jgi:hypothetical protein
LGLFLALIDLHFGIRNLAILPGMRIATMGIVLFILLPTLRVLLMLLVFVREHDYGLAAAAALVPAIVLLGVIIGIRTTSITNGNPLQTSRPITGSSQDSKSERGKIARA